VRCNATPRHAGGYILTEQDYRCTIKVEDESCSAGLSWWDNPYRHNQLRQKDVENPQFTVECDKERRKIHEGTIGSAMGGTLMDAGEASLSDISADLIHDKLATWITNILGREPSTLSSA
jgi:hypothetical protein